MSVSNPFSANLPIPAERLEECRACPRLVSWREAAAASVPPRFRKFVQERGFWGRPVSGFGDPTAWLAIVGLAPAAQGANRTGRMFTGDRSGEFLYAALHRAGIASAPRSEHRDDGLTLKGALITAALRCAPPSNRPEPDELGRCRAFLASDLAGLANLRVVLALGAIAHAAVLSLLRTTRSQGAGDGGRTGERPPDPGPRTPVFRHGAEHVLPGGIWLIDSYHVSQQNTFTGRLTPAMFDAVLARCHALASAREATL